MTGEQFPDTSENTAEILLTEYTQAVLIMAKLPPYEYSVKKIADKLLAYIHELEQRCGEA